MNYFRCGAKVWVFIRPDLNKLDNRESLFKQFDKLAVFENSAHLDEMFAKGAILLEPGDVLWDFDGVHLSNTDAKHMLVFNHQACITWSIPQSKEQHPVAIFTHMTPCTWQNWHAHMTTPNHPMAQNEKITPQMLPILVWVDSLHVWSWHCHALLQRKVVRNKVMVERNKVSWQAALPKSCLFPSKVFYKRPIWAMLHLVKGEHTKIKKKADARSGNCVINETCGEIEKAYQIVDFMRDHWGESWVGITRYVTQVPKSWAELGEELDLGFLTQFCNIDWCGIHVDLEWQMLLYEVHWEKKK
jgi:hypothetical protein